MAVSDTRVNDGAVRRSPLAVRLTPLKSA